MLKSNSDYTANINPRLGWLGLLGFLGFGGFWTYQINNMIFPFCFLCLFGLFGLFYDGKMKHTLKDEMYKDNERKASLKALKLGFGFSYALVIVSSSGIWDIIVTKDFLLIFLLIGMSLNVAIVVVLSRFYLYKFDSLEKDNECGY